MTDAADILMIQTLEQWADLTEGRYWTLERRWDGKYRCSLCWDEHLVIKVANTPMVAILKAMEEAVPA